jgi:hypothetical protein
MLPPSPTSGGSKVLWGDLPPSWDWVFLNQRLPGFAKPGIRAALSMEKWS